MGGFRNPINRKFVCLAGFQESPSFFFNSVKSLEKWNSKRSGRPRAVSQLLWLVSTKRTAAQCKQQWARWEKQVWRILCGSRLLANTCILSSGTSAGFHYSWAHMLEKVNSCFGHSCQWTYLTSNTTLQVSQLNSLGWFACFYLSPLLSFYFKTLLKFLI